MCHGLAEARGDTVQDDIDEVIVHNLGTEIESIVVIEVFLNRTCLFEISDLVTSPVWLVVIVIVLLNALLNLFPSIESMLVGFPPFQHIPFGT